MLTIPPSATVPVAAVDLGSNSFHMIVAEFRAGELIVVDKLREMIRLGAGLTPQRHLSPDAQNRALACLARFGERLRDFPPGSVRAVGTNTLRTARNGAQFLVLAERTLGHPIEIISGIEEARLIYLGVSRSCPQDGKCRLVMDIGGGSTEYIIGVDQESRHKESLSMGCVSMNMTHFPDGKITAKRFRKAVLAAEQKLEPFQRAFQAGQWDEAVGASGTIRAIRKILVGRKWCREGIDRDGLNRLVDTTLAAGVADRHNFPDLNPERYPSFAGGLAILHASFNTLNIHTMRVSDSALREGLLYDLKGRLFEDDIRSRTVATLASRYQVDKVHVAHIRQTLRSLLRNCPDADGHEPETWQQWLEWAASLHEIGLDIAHSQYHKHSEYIIRNADLPGFSRQDQIFLATLVRAHRRKFPLKLFRELPPPWDTLAIRLSILLRLAVLLNRSRHPQFLAEIQLRFGEAEVSLAFPEDWLEQHPLTRADLEQEAGYLRAAGIALSWGG